MILLNIIILYFLLSVACNAVMLVEINQRVTLKNLFKGSPVTNFYSPLSALSVIYLKHIGKWEDFKKNSKVWKEWHDKRRD